MLGLTILNLILSTIAIFVTGYILPGVNIRSIWIALAVAVVLGILNSFIRPILLVLTLPINILTLGLLTFVIMGFTVWLTSLVIPGFEVENFLWCMVFAVVLSLINLLIGLIF